MIHDNRGNIFALLFAAVALVGVVSVLGMQTITGPISTATRATQKNMIETHLMTNARLVIMNAGAQAGGGDVDGDGIIEPIEYVPNGTAGCTITLTGGGCLPSSLGAALTDPFGSPYGYCVWDHGAVNNGHVDGNPVAPFRLRGTNDPTRPVIALISAGPDRAFQTTCNAFDGVGQDGPVKPVGSDDYVFTYTYNEALASSGGLWTVKLADPQTAEIAKDLEVKDSGGNVTVSVDRSTGIGDFLGITTDLIAPKTGAGVLLDGRLGIGMSDPQDAIHLWSNGSIGIRIEADADDAGGEGHNPTIRMSQDGGSIGVNIGFINDLNSGNTFRIGRRYSNTDHWDTFSINTVNGNTGIGTNAPVSKLTVQETSASTATYTSVRQADASRRVHFQARAGSDVVWNLVQLNGNQMSVEVGGDGAANESLRLLPSGPIYMRSLIDPTPASEAFEYALVLNRPGAAVSGTRAGLAFHASGTVSGRTPGAAIVLERLGPDGSNSRGNLHFMTRTGTAALSPLATRLMITPDGAVGIGTEEPAEKLDVAGNLKVAGYITTSFPSAGAKKIVSQQKITAASMHQYGANPNAFDWTYVGPRELRLQSNSAFGLDIIATQEVIPSGIIPSGGRYLISVQWAHHCTNSTSDCDPTLVVSDRTNAVGAYILDQNQVYLRSCAITNQGNSFTNHTSAITWLTGTKRSPRSGTLFVLIEANGETTISYMSHGRTVSAASTRSIDLGQGLDFAIIQADNENIEYVFEEADITIYQLSPTDDPFVM